LVKKYIHKKKATIGLIDSLRFVSGFNEWFKNIPSEEKVLFQDTIMKHMHSSDYLVCIFNKQAELDASIIAKKAKWLPKTKDLLLETIGEIVEALEHVGHKWWKLKEKVSNELFLEEMVDALHFFVSALLSTNASAVDLFAGYMHKNEINEERAAGSY